MNPGSERIEIESDITQRTRRATRQETEQQILGCWNIITDIRVLREAVEADDVPRDQLIAILSGIQYLYDLKFDALFTSFESDGRMR